MKPSGLRSLLPILIFVFSNNVNGQTPSTTVSTTPSTSLSNGITQVLQDLENSKVFNDKTCASYINTKTDYLFNLPADRLVPKTPQDISYFKEHGVELIRKIFLVRVRLHEHLHRFDSLGTLTNECILKVREGLQYSRFTEEYFLEWLVHNKVATFKDSPILAGAEPFVIRNPKFKDIKLQAGDVMLIRGTSFVSAMIARIADEEGNFSHVAIVGEDDKGSLYVVESLIQTGVIVTPLEQWRKAKDARVALFRQNDRDLGLKAAKLVYKWGLQHADYDFEMDDSKYDKAFCAEVVRYAYDKASDGKFIVPKFRSHVSKFKGGPYPKSLGVTQETLFAPYDIEVDPRFEYVAEGKFYPELRQVRMQDSILQSIYAWMIEKNYEFHGSVNIATQSYIGKTIRQFGFMKEDFPKYMPVKTMQAVMQFQQVAEALEKNLYEKEKLYYDGHGYLPSFLEMMIANDEFRKLDCRWYNSGQASKFHNIFRAKSCD